MFVIVNVELRCLEIVSMQTVSHVTTKKCSEKTKVEAWTDYVPGATGKNYSGRQGLFAQIGGESAKSPGPGLIKILFS